MLRTLHSDGRVDVVASSPWSTKIERYEDLAEDGKVWANKTVSANVDYPIGVHAGDIDDDGGTDIVAGAAHSNRVDSGRTGKRMRRLKVICWRCRLRRLVGFHE